MDFRFSMIVEYAPLFIDGVKMTLGITVIAVVLGTLIGLFMGMARLADARHGMGKYLLRYCVKWPATAYVTFFRGTPLFVQILLVHFALMPTLVHPVDGILISGDLAREIRQNYGAFFSGLLALTLNAGAYITEIFRAGILSIDKGQMEAARSLGMSYGQAMRFVVVPQAFRRMLPPLGNEAIMLLKDSSLVSAIGLAELAFAARTVAGVYSRYWEPYLTISFMYLALTMLMAWGIAALEKRYRVASH
ncbi:amino acid ABC transporter permease [Laribacter hongkongensis]|jgi:polar amino acid transport system permease protein|uniref:Putative glutamine transport system permease protein GlnP n=2 Tax=Laribacter hongkongensis TaxID=168471 RepID=C1DA93_LARHH|nr:amino acid ABC transporter permease [Laribacter hongkongensis]MBP8813215.1 amino acid ABC transporter permease [Laribacter sp.]ACO75208.1 amino acid ABC transporter, permease protein, 3-TM region, His/Glu/Gln/Arg/opine [Laribacter hongkongensis HLHK9]ASJ25123.1 amino acid ABC transporter permease [Laribacter hongkongensis]MBE5530202.1 amino acid ABC transporter permease [Laribacter hongkongensis]MBP9526873.1 amino acid ABC transporter permease [Laribacter sp.]